MDYLDDGSLECNHAPIDVKDWLETIGLQLNILRFMQWEWPSEER